LDHVNFRDPKFTRVEMSDMKILDHGTAAVVTCRGTFEGPQFAGDTVFLDVVCQEIIADEPRAFVIRRGMRVGTGSVELPVSYDKARFGCATTDIYPQT
jgi:hypothetical protein